MSREKKTREYSSSLAINGNIRCQRIYPVVGRKTVGVELTPAQGRHLATVLLVASQQWNEIEVTAWRTRRADGTYQVTVTRKKLRK